MKAITNRYGAITICAPKNSGRIDLTLFAEAVTPYPCPREIVWKATSPTGNCYCVDVDGNPVAHRLTHRHYHLAHRSIHTTVGI